MLTAEEDHCRTLVTGDALVGGIRIRGLYMTRSLLFPVVDCHKASTWQRHCVRQLRRKPGWQRAAMWPQVGAHLLDHQICVFLESRSNMGVDKVCNKNSHVVYRGFYD